MCILKRILHMYSVRNITYHITCTRIEKRIGINTHAYVDSMQLWFTLVIVWSLAFHFKGILVSSDNVRFSVLG